MTARVTVAGSLNMDLVLRSPRIPQPGVTIIGSAFHIVPAYAAPRSKEAKNASVVPPSDRLNLAVIGCGARGGAIGNQAIS